MAAISEIFRQFLVAVVNGTYVYGGTNVYLTKLRLVWNKMLPQRQPLPIDANVIINALNNLGYNIPNCN